MRRRAFSLPELLLSMALFSLVMLAAYVLLDRGVRMWHNVSGAEAAGLQLKRANRLLSADLLETGYTRSQVDQVPSHLAGGAKDGSVLWFLSAVDPITEKMVYKPDGTPFWQRNVIYYLVVPTGDSCVGLEGPDQLDCACPHKVLIRKVVDNPPGTSATSDPETTEEVLLAPADVQAYLTRPNGPDISAMLGEAHVSGARVVARDLVWFEATRRPDPEIAAEIQVDLRAVALEDVRREQAVGATSLLEGRFTQAHMISVFPKN